MKTTRPVVLVCLIIGAAFIAPVCDAAPPALRYAGVYSPDARYGAGDIVNFQGNLYEALSDRADRLTPSTNPDHWTEILYSGGSSDVAIGSDAISADYSDDDGNTAVGYEALQTVSQYPGPDSASSDQGYDVAVGYDALETENSVNGWDTAVGAGAMVSDSSGGFNVAIGDLALVHVYGGDILDGGGGNTAVGYSALGNDRGLTGENNIAIGEYAGSTLTSGDNNIYVGGGPSGDTENATTRIGGQGIQTRAFVAGISGTGAIISGGAAVYVLSDGQLGTETSSRRFKTDIAPMGDSSSVLLELKPVIFKYKPQYDPKGIQQFGLVAEDVDKVCPSLVVRDEKGQIQTVRYEQVNAMLLNEFLKEHQRVLEQATALTAQGERIAGQEKRFAAQDQTIADQQKQIEALTTHLAEVAGQMQEIAKRIGGSSAYQPVANVNIR